MIKLCVMETGDGQLFARENEQRLLRNMDVHVVVLDLLKIPFEKVWVGCSKIEEIKWFLSFVFLQAEDTRMNHIMKLAHNLLQYFAYENPINQTKLYDLYFHDYHQLSEVKRNHLIETSKVNVLLRFRNKKSKLVVLFSVIIFIFAKRSLRNTFNISFIWSSFMVEKWFSLNFFKPLSKLKINTLKIVKIWLCQKYEKRSISLSRLKFFSLFTVDHVRWSFIILWKRKSQRFSRTNEIWIGTKWSEFIAQLSHWISSSSGDVHRGQKRFNWDQMSFFDRSWRFSSHRDASRLFARSKIIVNFRILFQWISMSFL